MQSWLGKKLLSSVMARMRQGDARPPLLLEHPDVQLTFPGRSSWSGVFQGKAEVRDWLQRFVNVGLQIVPDEVIVQGMPWNTTVCVRGRDYLEAEDGEPVYQNRFVIWGRMVWGRLRQYEVYEDTHSPDRLDAYLREHKPSLIAT